MNAYHGRNVSRRQWQFTVAVLACALIAGLGYSPILMAETHRYQASLHEADWQVSASVFECRLFQTIPGFGEAEFVHQAGEALEFRIDSYADVVDGGDLVLRSEPPPWNFKRQAVVLAELEAVQNPARVAFDTMMARRLISEMLVGMVPTLSGRSSFAHDQLINVGLSPLRFKAAYNSYQHCAGDLLPVNYEQVGRSTLFWPSGSRQLTAEARQLLDNIVLYSRADERVVGFEVDSFTDTAGETRENLLLSEERAFLVTNYLISQGVDPETIATRAHGEREELLVVNPERTAADRNRNRRVNIVMLRR
jgi:outer membrane protein OmpA-like peptidoglycan-associated protein